MIDIHGSPSAQSIAVTGEQFRRIAPFLADGSDAQVFINEDSRIAWIPDGASASPIGRMLVKMLGTVTPQQYAQLLAESVLDECFAGMWQGEADLIFHQVRAVGVDTSQNEEPLHAVVARWKAAAKATECGECEGAACLAAYREAYEASMRRRLAAWEAAEVPCECGVWTGQKCDWRGTKARAVVVEHMPRSLRAAGHHGTYPDNGAVRMYCSPDCAQHLEEYDGEWSEVIAGPEWF